MADGKVIIDIAADDSEFKKSVDGLEDEAKKAAGGMDDLGDSAKDAGKGLDAADVAAGSLVANGLTSLISGIGDAIGSLAGLATETREYREDMAKLETAFKTTGHSSETANKAYEDFYAILGESDRSVEAVNHLAELTKSEQEVAKWSDIAAGVTAKFGDSLPIEGLTEAANETAKVGKVTGPLADALNWAGISEEEFNEKLAACNSEQERSTLITETLNEKYKEAANEYNELTKGTQDMNRAQSELEQTQAALGEAMAPLQTAFTNLKAQALDLLLPVVEAVAGGFEKLQKWMAENPEKAEILKAVLLGIAAALGVLAVALGISSLIQMVTVAFGALNLTMLANPIVLIVAAIAALVAAFIYLWNNCESFRNFWIGLWDAIKNAFSVAVDWISEKVDAVGKFFTETLPSKISEFANKLKEFWTETVPEFFAGVIDWFKKLPGEVWKWLLNTINKVITFGIYLKAKGIEAAAGLFNSIVDGVKELPAKMLEIGSNIVSGLWDGISSGWDWLTDKVSSLASSLFEAAKDVLGIESPSKKFAYVGEMSVAGIDKGFEAEMPNAEKNIKKSLGTMTARLQTTVAAEGVKVGQNVAGQDTGLYAIANAVGTQTAGINSLAGEYRRGASNKQPIILQLNGRELGRAVVDLGGQESVRRGVSLAY